MRRAVVGISRKTLVSSGTAKPSLSAFPSNVSALSNSAFSTAAATTHDRVQPMKSSGSAKPKPKPFSNQRMLAAFDKSVRDNNITHSWYLYNRLLERSKNSTEQTDKYPLLAKRVVPRRLLMSPKLRQASLHSKILSVLKLQNVHVYNPRITEKLTEMVRSVLGTIDAEGGELSTSDLNNLLGYFASVKNAEAVDHVWQYATLSGMPRDITNYNAYINANIVTGQYDRALEVAREVRQAGLQPNTYTQTCLIRLYGLTGDLESAKRIFALVCSSSTLGQASRRVQYWQDAVDDAHLSGPNVYVYNEMLQVYGVNGLVDDMRSLFMRMLGLDGKAELDQVADAVVRQTKHTRLCRPNIDTFHTMIKWHAKYWDLERAVKYMEMMQLYGIKPTASTFKLMITKDTAVRDLRRCGELALEMTTKYGIAPVRSIVNVLEVSAKKVKSMDEMIRESEMQRSTLFPSLSLDDLSLTGTHSDGKEVGHPHPSRA
ncbi:hypothetical protein GGI12_005556 [Dipsacomyces acuminosporus]|nr:hypothetical protein GGI12_005556 [Dipsacomyces acuminosporus]